MQADETYLIEMKAQGNAQRRMEDLGAEGKRTGDRVERAMNQARDAQGRFIRRTKVAQREVRELRAASTGFEVGFVKAAGVAGAAITAGIGVALINASAEAEAVSGKFDTVFKELADDARASAEEIADSFGRSQTDVERFLATFQDTFVPFGFARDEAAGLSEQVTRLAIDLASFNDLSDQQGLEDLQSALVGNVETMRKYGVIINQTVLDQKLLEQGIEGGVKAATEQEKVLARLELIMEGTADAQGDAVRTADEWNNSVKRLTGDVRDLSVTYGDELREHVVESIDEFGGLEAVLELVEFGMGAVTDAFKLGVDVIVIGAEVLREWIDQAGGVDVAGRRLEALFKTIGFTVEAVGVIAEEVWLTFTNGLDTIFSGAEALVGVLQSVGNVLVSGVAAGFSIALDGALFVFEALQQIDGVLRDGLVAALGLFVDGMVAAASVAADVADALGIDGIASDIRGLGEEAEAFKAQLQEDRGQGFLEGAARNIEEFQAAIDQFSTERFDAASQNISESVDTVLSLAERVEERGGDIFGALAELAAEKGADAMREAALIIADESEVTGAIIAEAVAEGAADELASGKSANVFTDWIVGSAVEAAKMASQVGAEVAGAATDEVAKSSSDAAEETASVWSDALGVISGNVRSLGSSWEDFLFGIAQGLLDLIAEYAEASATISAPSGGGGGEEGGFLSGIGNLLGNLVLAYDGGVMKGGGSPIPGGSQLASALGMPFNAYEGGGVVTGPQLFLAGEGQTDEAIIPLRDGAVDVRLTGGGGGVTVNVYNSPTVNALDQRGVREVLMENADAVAAAVEDRVRGRRSFRDSLRRHVGPGS